MKNIIVIAILQAVILLPGCQNQKPSRSNNKILLVVTIGRVEESNIHDVPSLSVSTAPQSSSPRKDSNSVLCRMRTDSGTMNGKQYLGMIVTDATKGSGILKVQAYNASQKKVCVHLSTKVRCELKITNFKGGHLMNIDTDKEINRPFILGPGKYHLEAVWKP